MPITEEPPSMTRPREIEVPAPTMWPLAMAFGITLVAAGLVTAPPLSLLGASLIVAGAVGWFRQALPREHTIAVPIEGEAEPVTIPRAPTTHPRIAEAGHRARLPLEVYPISAGVKGGLLGGVVMAALAIAYGL